MNFIIFSFHNLQIAPFFLTQQHHISNKTKGIKKEMKTFSFTIHERKENFVINLEWKLPRDGIREKVSRELRRPASAIKNIPLKLFTRYNRKRKFHFFNWLLFIPFLPSLSLSMAEQVNLI